MSDLLLSMYYHCMYVFSVTRKIRVSHALLLIFLSLVWVVGQFDCNYNVALVVKNELIPQIGVA